MTRSGSYDDRWRRLEAAGINPHGEADLVCWFEPSSVLDAGCGTGRVAVELNRRGIHTVGVDRDPEMLAAARTKAPHLTWIQADLADVIVGPSSDPSSKALNEHVRAPYGFDLVVMAGNVMVFVTPGTEAAVVANMARHLRPGGHLVAGFQLVRDRLTFEDYDQIAAEVGLDLEHRWSTWDREPYDNGAYAVMVHRG